MSLLKLRDTIIAVSLTGHIVFTSLNNEEDELIFNQVLIRKISFC